MFYSKRDAKTFFDQLLVGKELQPYFGRPTVRAEDLALELGVDLWELRNYLDDGIDQQLLTTTVLTPVSAVWPMGFAWSYCVAQATMV